MDPWCYIFPLLRFHFLFFFKCLMYKITQDLKPQTKDQKKMKKKKIEKIIFGWINLDEGLSVVFFLTSCGTLYFQCFHAPIGSLFPLSTTSNWFLLSALNVNLSVFLLFFFNRLPFYKRCLKVFRDALEMITLHANLFISSSWCQLMTYLYNLLHDSQSVWLSLCCWSFTASTARRERKSFSSAFLEKLKVCFSLFFPSHPSSTREALTDDRQNSPEGGGL